MDKSCGYPSHSGMVFELGLGSGEGRKGEREGGRERKRNEHVWQTLPNT